MSKHGVSGHPIGATWTLVEKSRKYYITLREISKYGFEIWCYGWSYEGDGSGGMSDWTTSFKTARKNLLVTGRFKRDIQ